MPGSSPWSYRVHVCRPRRVRGRTGGVACDVFYDADLGDRIKSEVREARERAQDRLVDAFEEHRAEIQDALDELHQGLDRYDDEMGPHVDAAIDGLEQLAAEEEKRVRDECGIRERRDRVEGVVDRVDHRAVVAEVDVPVPAPDTPGLMTRSSTRGGPFSNS